MQIVIFTQGSLHFADELPRSAPVDGFVWVFTERESITTDLPKLQTLAQQVGGSALLDLHCQDWPLLPTPRITTTPLSMIW